MECNRNPRVSIIIVNYNGARFLRECLSCLHQQDYSDYEVVIVDNASTDESVELVNAEYSWVKLIRAPTNLGFAGGNNLGFSESSGEYVVLLNNDTAPERTWLRNLVSSADSDERVGAVGSKILLWGKFLPITMMTESFIPRNRGSSDDGRVLGFKLQEDIFFAESEYRKTFYESGFSSIEWDVVKQCRFRWGSGVARVFVPFHESASNLTIVLSAARGDSSSESTLTVLIGDTKIGRFALSAEYEQFRLGISEENLRRFEVDLINNAGSYRRPKGVAGDIGFGEVDHGQFNHPGTPNSLCGCSVLLRRRMLDEIGTFDDRLFMYFEDVDLFWRAGKKGWRLVYCPDSVVRHRHAASSQEWSPFFVFYVLRNQFLVVVKNGSVRDVLGASVNLLRPLARALVDVLSSLLRGSFERTAVRTVRERLPIVMSAIRNTIPFLYTRWKGRR